NARAQKECRAAIRLFGGGLDAWCSEHAINPVHAREVRAAADRALDAYRACEAWLATRTAAPEGAYAVGAETFDVLLRRGHLVERSAGDLLRETRDAIRPAQEQLAELSRDATPDSVPAPDSYLRAFQQKWDACRALSAERDFVTWPEWPLRYVPFPAWARDAAPDLYWLFYRSPAPFDAYTVHEYCVNPGWPESAITLNHVVHHGALGHHVQNWHAVHRSRSRIGTVAAVDCANRIGMFLGGSLAEGWACYATELMDECGFLTPAERAAEQQSRVRMLARAVVDISLHTHRMTTRDAVRFYVDEVGMTPNAADAEVSKNTMFPCTAVMYWLGTSTILNLRAARERALGSAFTLREFHDELLSYGAIPVSFIAHLMTADQ
ncbi:MAG TPA: DUF885 family protein, partial [Gemmatimonadaceae bacterium]|nr:DUF885 family protein [Gemmatimonadaceae bacterium]